MVEIAGHKAWRISVLAYHLLLCSLNEFFKDLRLIFTSENWNTNNNLPDKVDYIVNNYKSLNVSGTKP